jgi:hypothetical protein
LNLKINYYTIISQDMSVLSWPIATAVLPVVFYFLPDKVQTWRKGDLREILQIPPAIL